MSNAVRLSSVWALLSALTLLSWWLGAKHEGMPFVADAAITIAVIVVALVKVRFIIRQFMEARTAPNWIKWLSDAWLLGLFVLLAGIYCFV